MLVSPTEPPMFRILGQVSSVPELYGCDFLMFAPGVGKVGVQRKEVGDLVASILDDRLNREVLQSRSLDVRMLIIEGDICWTNDGLLLSTRSEFSRAQLLGILWSLQSEGFWITYSNSTTDTIECLSAFNRWITKPKHTTLLQRKKQPKNMYGTRGSEDWQINFLQGLPGLGYERAKSVVEYYGGLPLAWTGTLSDVPGIGAKLSTKLADLLSSEDGKKEEGKPQSVLQGTMSLRAKAEPTERVKGPHHLGDKEG